MGKPIGVSADMCDTTISYDRFTGMVKYRLYDKLQHMQGFSREVIRYTASDSNGPKAVLKSIVVGQMTAYAQRCREFGDFMEACSRLFIRLIGNGHEPWQITAAVREIDLLQPCGQGPKIPSKRNWTWDKENRTRMLRLIAGCHIALRERPLSERQEVFKGVANDHLSKLIAHLKYKHNF